jgi:TatA/E family protein of Tat protein translocase
MVLRSLAKPGPQAYTCTSSGMELGREEFAGHGAQGHQGTQEGWTFMEWGIVAVIAVAVIFGATKLPELARNFGRAQGEFKKGLKEGAVEDAPPEKRPEADKPAE